MNHFLRAASTVAIGLAAALAIQAGGGEDQPASRDISQLHWMAGAWVNDSEQSCSEEHWMPPRGGSMIGMNRMLRKAAGDPVQERTVFYEFLRIEQNAEGLVYLASPKGRQPSTAFKLSRIAANEVVFENPEHDFPQRITYRRDADTMHARIEGTQNGQPASEEWTWRLVK